MSLSVGYTYFTLLNIWAGFTMLYALPTDLRNRYLKICVPTWRFADSAYKIWIKNYFWIGYFVKILRFNTQHRIYCTEIYLSKFCTRYSLNHLHRYHNLLNIAYIYSHLYHYNILNHKRLDIVHFWKIIHRRYRKYSRPHCINA